MDAEGSGRGDMIPSLLRPRRSTTLRRADEEDEPVLQLHWPVSFIIINNNLPSKGSQALVAMDTYYNLL